MRVRFSVCLLFILMVATSSALGQSPGRDPVIDMHVHASAPDGQGPPPLAICTPIGRMPAWDAAASSYMDVFMAFTKEPGCSDPIWSPSTETEMRDRTLSEMTTWNVIGVVSPDKAAYLAQWRAAAPDRIIPSGTPFDILKVDAATVERVRALKASGDLKVLGEVGTQYRGIAPDDPRMAAFWKMAEDLDLPVGIHVGTGPPGTPYLADDLKHYRARMHSAMTMEEVLVKHPKLRVYLMHAGYPLLDDLLAVLYTHPQVYVDIGVIVYTQPRPAFYRYLQGIVDAGFGDRVMFGSDNMIWPETIGRSIRVIEEAPFLDAAQKRDILYNNAARFLRLTEEEKARHRAL